MNKTIMHEACPKENKWPTYKLFFIRLKLFTYLICFFSKPCHLFRDVLRNARILASLLSPVNLWPRLTVYIFRADDTECYRQMVNRLRCISIVRRAVEILWYPRVPGISTERSWNCILQIYAGTVFRIIL